jgi:carbonic anhydrase/acetyltransferase-like protein (isoleucine patch superfamily)
MLDRGDSSFECLIEETSNIQDCCLLYQTFKAAVSSIKHSRLLSPLSSIQGCCHLSSIQGGLECLIEETGGLNV